MERYLQVNLLGPGPRLMKKEFTGPRTHKASETLHWLQRSGELHGPAGRSLRRGRYRNRRHTRDLHEPQSRSRICGEEKIPSTYRESNFGQPFAILSDYLDPKLLTQ